MEAINIAGTAIESISAEAQRRATEDILDRMDKVLDGNQMMELNKILNTEFNKVQLCMKKEDIHLDYMNENVHVVKEFFKAKTVEGLSQRTLFYYKDIYNSFFTYMQKHYTLITTEDIREYLDWYQGLNNCSNITLDNHRKGLSTLFSWMHKNEYIFKNPMVRIKKIKGQHKVKKAFSDLEIETLRDNIGPEDYRTRAVFELLLSSGIRVGELKGLNRDDMNFHTMSFKVLGKGNKERVAYFNDTAKLYLQKYLKSRTDDEPALFIASKPEPHRLSKHQHEKMIRELGIKAGVEKTHPHRFRRTMATRAIERGMPIEQVQKLLGHENISTTMIYVNVDQDAVKLNHNKYTN